MLKFDDVRELYRMGVRFTENDDSQAMEDSVLYWVIAHPMDRQSVRLNFEEGVRNYSKNMKNHDRIMGYFDQRCQLVSADME